MEKSRYRPSPEEWFGSFVEATGCQETLEIFENIKNALDIEENQQREVYEKLKSRLTSWKCQSLWDLIDTRAKHAEYGKGKICSELNVLIIGAGPIGLRTAIETALLGCRTVIVEKRKEFTRNNVLHLWPFLLTDFRALGAKKFYGKFCAGSIDHISIKQLQSIFFKICLILGVEIYTGVEFKALIEATKDHGWRAQLSPYKEKLDNYEFDVIVGADGKKDMLPGFPQVEMRGALAIGITCNFVNENTVAEAGVEEISGVAYQFNPQFFDDLSEQFDVRLENIVYYKDETHYFVMTALKSSLLKRKVFRQDFSDPTKLLEKQNVDLDQLIQYTLDTVHYATNYKLPQDIKLVQNDNGTPDIAVFDFTSLKKAASASRIMERKGKRLLMSLVGDSLLEPFWPTGSGCGRGVLSALDAAWMIRLFGMKMSPLGVLKERENVFKLLSGTDSNNLQKNHKAFTINPTTRYSNLNHVQSVNVAYLKKLYDTDDPENADYSLPEPIIPSRFEIGRAQTMPPPRTRRKSGGKRRVSTSSHKRRSDRTTLREAKHVSKATAMWEDKIPKKPVSGCPSKRTKPSQSGSASGSGLESVSESEHEESGVPYQRAMAVRKRNQSNDTTSDVFTGSSADELEMKDHERKLLVLKPSIGAAPVDDQRLNDVATTETQEKRHHKGGVIRRLLGRGRGDHDVERRKSIAARKSLSKARRLRRKSGAGSQSSQSQPECESTALLPKTGYDSVTVRKKQQRTQISDEGETVFKAPKPVPGAENPETQKSAKMLIAAAEARDSQSGVGKSDSLKRKADEIANDSKSSRYENVPWSHCLPALESLLPNEEESKNNVQTVKQASQVAGLLLLSVPLLLPCRVRLVGKHSSMLAEKRNTLVRSSVEKRETRKISLSRAGSVQKAVAQIKTKLEKENTTTSFEKFKRNRSSGSFQRDSAPSSGKASPFQTQSTEEDHQPVSSLPLNTDDYEIIEMKSTAQQPKERLKIEEDFDVISGSEVKMDTIDGIEAAKEKKTFRKKTVKLNKEEILRGMLSQLCKEQRLTSVQITLEILHGMHKSISKNQGIEKYYRIYTKGRNFESYIWSYEICRNFLKQIGWETCGSFIVLSKSTQIKEPLMVIEEAKSDVERLIRNRPNQSREDTEVDSQKSCIPNGDSTWRSGEAKDFTSEANDFDLESKSPNGLRNGLQYWNGKKETTSENSGSLNDSSGREENDTDSFEERLESSEGYIGDEEYLIVDFAKDKSDRLELRNHDGVAARLGRMEDAVYGMDGRRRRQPSVEIKEPDEPGLTKRVSLRKRLRERRVDENSHGDSLAAESEKTAIKSRDDRDGLYDERGRRRRSRGAERSQQKTTETSDPTSTGMRNDDEGNRERIRGRASNNDLAQHPSKEQPSRGSQQLNFVRRKRETTTTLSKSPDNESMCQTDREKKTRAMDQTDLSENRLLCPDRVIKDVESTHDSSKASILSRLEQLRKNGESDSSGNESGKKKKLVLKRGSMRRKKLLESDQSTTDNETPAEDIKSNRNMADEEKKEALPAKIMDEEKLRNEKYTNMKSEPAPRDRSKEMHGTVNSSDRHYEQTLKDVHESRDDNASDIIGRQSVQDIISGLNKVNFDKGKDAVKSNDTITTNSNSVKSSEIANDKIQNGVNGLNDEPKKEKKYKLVLKVKRKKAKTDANACNTIETPPATARDEEPGAVKPLDSKKVEHVAKDNEKQSTGNGASNVNEENEMINKNKNLNSDKVSEEKTEHSVGKYLEKRAKDKVAECKEVTKEKEENCNGQHEVSNHPKKKKFVLKRKKKVAS